MARIRTIKPEIWKDEALGEMPADVHLFFIALWNFCDKAGFIEYRPKRLKAEIFPYREFDITAAVDTLSPDFIRIVTIDGIDYLHVVNFKKHQICSVREPESIIPEEYWHSTGTVPVHDKHSTGTVPVHDKHSAGITGKGKGKGKGIGKEGGKDLVAKKKFCDPIKDRQSRVEEFMNEVATFKGLYPDEMLRAFFNYWTEPTKNGKHFRKEREPTWDTSRRLSYWHNNDSKISRNARPANSKLTREDLQRIAEFVDGEQPAL